MASPLVFKSCQIFNSCFEFTLRYRLPIYLDPKTRYIIVEKSISKVLPLSIFVVLNQGFTLLLMLFVLEPIHFPNTVIGAELKMVYLISILLCNTALFLGACLYYYAEIFAFFHNTLAGFDSDFRRLCLSNFRPLKDNLSHRILKGNYYLLTTLLSSDFFITCFIICFRNTWSI